MVYYNITVFSYILHFVHYRYILHKEQVNPPKVGKRKRKVTLFINLGIFAFISESLIEFATFACNENFFYDVLGEVNRTKQHVLLNFKI